ncbi:MULTISPECIES: ScbR family autoregulator-binding transcription factor [unclassified Streptomyces]|uniref:ScbR family autoregulator-binding transcription factor n=1 Tax=unclassified Streptomyces TaxID=2593676 RepID=UPI0020348D76|nr:ScbR family autoregulator-binding transcription factor [Streptomyces sp. RKAG290]MCM2416230.1 TetR/AcrR family transcriptional regulator [Streptomyces sp. RKAG290]
MVKQDRAARTRRSLIHAAAEVFAREGFAPASLATISRRAGVSNGALHFHFENKRALAQAVEDEAAQTVRRITEEGAVGPGGALQALVDTTHALMRALADDIVVRAGFGLGGDAARGQEFWLRREWQRWIEDMLRCAEAEGRLAEGVSPHDASPAIVAVTVGLEVLGGDDRGWLSGETVAGFWDLVLPGLASRREPVPVSSPRPGGTPARWSRPLG